MTRAILLILGLALAGCHRPQADQPNPGADGDAQAATANKTIADLQAADDAAQGPAPEIAPVIHHEERPAAKPIKPDEAPPADDAANLPVPAPEGNST